jgi:hypothetical protein
MQFCIPSRTVPLRSLAPSILGRYAFLKRFCRMRGSFSVILLPVLQSAVLGICYMCNGVFRSGKESGCACTTERFVYVCVCGCVAKSADR